MADRQELYVRLRGGFRRVLVSLGVQLAPCSGGCRRGGGGCALTCRVLAAGGAHPGPQLGAGESPVPIPTTSPGCWDLGAAQPLSAPPSPSLPLPGQRGVRQAAQRPLRGVPAPSPAPRAPAPPAQPQPTAHRPAVARGRGGGQPAPPAPDAPAAAARAPQQLLRPAPPGAGPRGRPRAPGFPACCECPGLRLGGS